MKFLHHSGQNFARLLDQYFTFPWEWLLKVWNQSRLDDSLYVVVSFFIANL